MKYSIADFKKLPALSSAADVQEYLINADKDDKDEQFVAYYGWLKRAENAFQNVRSGKRRSEALESLLTKDFDVEQIWQQLELQNKANVRSVKRLLKSAADGQLELLESEQSSSSPFVEKRRRTEVVDEEDESGSDSEDATARDNDSVGDDAQDEIGKEQEQVTTAASASGLPSVVDDQFFSLVEMTQFLEKQDRLFERQMDDDDQVTDLIAAESKGDEDACTENCRYSDFFDTPTNSRSQVKAGKTGVRTKRKRVRFAADAGATLSADKLSGNDEKEDVSVTSPVADRVEYGAVEDGEEKSQSTFELRQSRLKATVEEMERQNLDEKTWQMKGETAAEVRPLNSLLDEHLTFDHSGTQPEITLDSTEKLESLIIQRIRDKCFDDVEHKVKPVAQPHRFRNELVLDEQQSKKSLAEIYEEQYLKQTQQFEEAEAKNPKHEAIKKQIKGLFQQLDALSNYHYAPKPLDAEVRIVKNMPAVAMEDSAVARADETTTVLAPEEIKEPSESDPAAAEELNETDRKRALRKKKALSKRKAEHQLERKKPTSSQGKAIHHNYGTTTRVSEGKLSSSDFFKKLSGSDANRSDKVSVKKRSTSMDKSALHLKF